MGDIRMKKRSFTILTTLLTMLTLMPCADAYKGGAIIETNKGDIVIEFYEKEAPLTTAHMKQLIQDGYYNQRGMRWHRVVPDFVIQTGDPTNTGKGGSDKTVDLEVRNGLSHCEAGIVAMARGTALNSASSQFYITLSPQISLDAKYAIFGRVIQGMRLLPKITPNDEVYQIRLADVEQMAIEAEAPVQEHPFWGIFKSSKKKKKACEESPKLQTELI